MLRQICHVYGSGFIYQWISTRIVSPRAIGSVGSSASGFVASYLRGWCPSLRCGRLPPVVLPFRPRRGGCLVFHCCCPLYLFAVLLFYRLVSLVPAGCPSSCLFLLSPWPLLCAVAPSSVPYSSSSPETTPPRASKTCTGWTGPGVQLSDASKQDRWYPKGRLGLLTEP